MRRRVVQAGILLLGVVFILMFIQVLKFGTPNGYIVFEDDSGKFVFFKVLEVFNGRVLMFFMSFVAVVLIYFFITSYLDRKEMDGHKLDGRPSRTFIELEREV